MGKLSAVSAPVRRRAKDEGCSIYVWGPKQLDHRDVESNSIYDWGPKQLDHRDVEPNFLPPGKKSSAGRDAGASGRAASSSTAAPVGNHLAPRPSRS